MTTNLTSQAVDTLLQQYSKMNSDRPTRAAEQNLMACFMACFPDIAEKYRLLEKALKYAAPFVSAYGSHEEEELVKKALSSDPLKE